jgi:hypothetical protein
MPIKQHVINIYLGKRHRNERKSMDRIKDNKSKNYMKSIKDRKKVEFDVKKYMIEHFSLMYL